MKKMKNYFTIGEAAAEANMTTETLRHYDRVGLVKPSRKDEWTNYRYYTKQDIVRLMTVRSLQQMDLPLKEIKQVLEYDSLGKIIAFLETAEKKADEKIALLQDGKAKIRLAIADYERILLGRKSKESAFVEHMPQRVILLSDTMETPSVDVLWNYLSHFNDKIPSDLKKYFSFEDLAGIYTENGVSRLFAVCRSYADTEDLKVLPEGIISVSIATKKTEMRQSIN